MNQNKVGKKTPEEVLAETEAFLEEYHQTGEVYDRGVFYNQNFVLLKKILTFWLVVDFIAEAVLIVVQIIYTPDVATTIVVTILFILFIIGYLWIHNKTKTVIYSKRNEIEVITAFARYVYPYEEIAEACRKKSVKYKMSCWYVPLPHGWLKIDEKNLIGCEMLKDRLREKCGIRFSGIDGKLKRLWVWSAISACIIASGLYLMILEIIVRIFEITDFLSIQNIIQTMSEVHNQNFFYGGLGTVAVGLFFYMLLIPLQAMELHRRGLNVKMKL